MYKCNIDIVCYIAVAGNKAYLFQKQIHFPSPLRHRKCTRVWIWFPHLSWIHQMDGGHCCKLGVVVGVVVVVVVAVDIVVQVWLWMKHLFGKNSEQKCKLQIISAGNVRLKLRNSSNKCFQNTFLIKFGLPVQSKH